MSALPTAWPVEEGARRATRLFTDTFRTEPAGVWSAPGRVNLIGEHTDYNAGLCLPIALPHRTYVALRPRDDARVRLVSAQEPDSRELDLATVGPAGSDGGIHGWPAYVAGVAWMMAAEGLVEGTCGFDVAVDSCVPYGAGLSSSAALECAVAIALAELHGLGLQDDAGRARLAAVCVRAENELAGAPTGGMDQAASLRCRPGSALLLDCQDGHTEHVPLDLVGAGLELLVIDTRAEHRLTDGHYAARRRACEAAAASLGVGSLRAVTDVPEALRRLREPAQRAAVRHVVSEIARTADLVEVLRSGPLTGPALVRAGELMDASHASLRDDYAVSVPELDVAVGTARRDGAHGARMTGGGFGGSAIALVDAGHAGDIAAGVRAAFARRGFTEPAFLLATAAGPAARVNATGPDDG